MGEFTFVPSWVIQDLVVLAATVITVVFILRHEEHPVSRILEMLAFSFLYAAVYENFATLMGWYGYGRSVLMVFNVPLTVPLVEYLVVYTGLRILDKAKIPTWTKPLAVGFFGMVFDFTLDPIATHEIAETLEGTISRWSWFPGPNDAQIYGEPVYNFPGWVLLCGYAACFLLLGRWWYAKSGYSRKVEILYPIVGMVVALGVMVSPLSRFLLWLEPPFEKGQYTEWIMLALHGGIGLATVLGIWRFRMKSEVGPRSEYPAWIVFIALPAINLLVAAIEGHWKVFWLVASASIVLSAVMIAAFVRGRNAKSPA